MVSLHPGLRATFMVWSLIISYRLVSSLGAVALRMDTIRVLSSAESSTVSLQGVSLSTIKTLTENMESCCPSCQTPNPVLKLTTIAFTYHITTHTVQVITSQPTMLFSSERDSVSAFISCVSIRSIVKRTSLLCGRHRTTWCYIST